MNFRIYFSFSKTERKLRLRFGKWDIWQLDSDSYFEDDISENVEKILRKAGFLSFKKEAGEAEEAEDAEETEDGNKLLLQALFYPQIERHLLSIGKRLSFSALNLFSVKFENTEIRGSLGDPFYDAIALGVSQDCYYPCWEDENSDWSAKGELVLKGSIFYTLYFLFLVLYAEVKLAFILWYGARIAKKDPNGEKLSAVRRWIFLKTKEAI